MLIPVCGDLIKIAKDVDVELKNIAQNKNFLEKYDEKLKNVKQINKKKHFITLKKGTLLTIDRVYIRQGEEKAILKEWYTSLPELRKSIIKLNNIEYANFNFLEVNESILKENNFIKYEVLENNILKLLSNFINNVSWMNNFEYRDFGYDFILRFSINDRFSIFKNIFNYDLNKLYCNYNISYETKNVLRKNLIEYKKISDIKFLNPNKIDWMEEIIVYKINNKEVSLKELRKELTKSKK